jgi:hypothetical protein
MRFQEFAPKWYEAIEILKKDGWRKYWAFCNDNDLNLGYHRRCIVGEAHGFKDDYLFNCRDCVDHSLNFNLTIGKDSFKEAIQVFEDHFCSEHSK